MAADLGKRPYHVWCDGTLVPRGGTCAGDPGLAAGCARAGSFESFARDQGEVRVGRLLLRSLKRVQATGRLTPPAGDSSSPTGRACRFARARPGGDHDRTPL